MPSSLGELRSKDKEFLEILSKKKILSPRNGYYPKHGYCPKKVCKQHSDGGEKRENAALCFSQFLIPKTGMLGVHQCYTNATLMLH